MTSNDAGNTASSARAPMSTDVPKTISPAARKFAEYLARRMRPMIESAAKRTEETQQANDAIAGHTQTKRG